MSKILNILNEIASEPGKNKKKEILSKYKENTLLKRVLYLGMSPRVNFYIKKIPNYTISSETDSTKLRTLNEALQALDKLSSRQLTGNQGVSHLQNILETSNPENAEVIEKVIGKDLKIGMDSSVNEVIPNLIEETPYMGAISFSEKHAKAIFENGGIGISQIKMDGRFANAIITDECVLLESRQGENNTLEGSALIQELSSLKDCVLNGELTIPGISRYESNGIVASLVSIQGKISKGEDVAQELKKFEKKHGNYLKRRDSVIYTAWDYLELQEYEYAASSISYYKRLEQLREAIKGCNYINVVETREVSTYAEAMAHFQEALARGEEGTILKAEDGKWKDGKPTWQIKMKLEMTLDLRIKDFQWGTKGTKNENVYSAIFVESDDGKIITKATGFKEDMMQELTDNPEKYRNKVVEIKCNGLSKAKDSTTYALLYPNFKRMRDDKNTTDTLGSAQAIENMLKELK